MKNDNISRRFFVTAGLASLGTTALPKEADAFDFIGGGNRSGFDFLGNGGRQPNHNVQRQPAQRQPQNTCASRAAAMNQRTASSRPITQHRYTGNAPVGSIQVSINSATLYHIVQPGVAHGYPIGAGDDSRSLVGKNLTIARKAAWPEWTPTANIARRMGISQKTVPGGPCNPLGAFALYLYEGGRDTIYRIHGTNAPKSVGNPEASSGCVRLYNEDVTRLQQSVPIGTSVRVHQGLVPGMAPATRRLTP